MWRKDDFCLNNIELEINYYILVGNKVLICDFYGCRIVSGKMSIEIVLGVFMGITENSIIPIIVFVLYYSMTPGQR